MTTPIIELPDNLTREVKEAGLLDPRAIESLLRETLRRRGIDELFSTADQLAAAHLPSMTLDEIQEEVNAVRAQRRQRASGA